MVGPPRLASGVWGSLNTGGQPGASGQLQPSSSQGAAHSQLGGSGKSLPWVSTSTPIK